MNDRALLLDVAHALLAAHGAIVELQGAIGRMAHPQSSWARLAREAERHVASATRALEKIPRASRIEKSATRGSRS